MDQFGKNIFNNKPINRIYLHLFSFIVFLEYFIVLRLHILHISVTFIPKYFIFLMLLMEFFVISDGLL